MLPLDHHSYHRSILSRKVTAVRAFDVHLSVCKAVLVSEQRMETGLGEMMIARQGIGDISFLHYDK